MRSQNRKCKSSSSGKVGGASCLLLLLLTFLVINPLSCLPVFAEGEEPEDYGIDTQSMTASTVTIAFSPTSASGSMTPVDETNGDKAKVDVQASIRVQNSGGYAVYVGSDSSELVNGTNVIKSVETESTYADLPINRWGYSFQEGTVAKDSYVAMPATLRSSALYSNNNTNIVDETKTFMLSFAARIGADMPAGTYTNSVTMSVVSSPRDVASLLELVNMQDMTSSICASSQVGDSKQLKDVRDGKYYWVSKLADNNCWMTQNLDLDLSTEVALTPADSDVKESWTPEFDTATIADADTILIDSSSQRSWNLGEVRIINPIEANNCGSGKTSAVECSEQFAAYATPTSTNGEVDAHYVLGNHYSWNAAVAGTGEMIVNEQAEGSICPRGWRLPTSNVSGELEVLVATLGGTSSTDNVTKPPFYGVRGGSVGQYTDYLLFDAGSSGFYWSSTQGPYNTTAYNLYFSPSVVINPSSERYRRDGRSVRCVAR